MCSSNDLTKVYVVGKDLESLISVFILTSSILSQMCMLGVEC
jgi:hypothetical protein